MLPQDFLDDRAWLNVVQTEIGLDKLAGLSRDSVYGLPRDQFGGVFVDDDLNAHSRFPMDTDTNLRLSAGYLLTGEHGLNKHAAANVAHNLLEGFYGRHWEPPVPIVELSKEATGDRVMSVHEALAPDLPRFSPYSENDCAVKIAGVPRFPIRDASEAQEAVRYFEDNWVHIPAEMRHGIANAFEKKAAAHEVHVGDVGKRYLGEQRSWLFKAAMAGRAILRPDCANLYAALVDEREPDLELLSCKLAEIDRLTGLDAHWDIAVPDPWVTVYDNTEKVAEEKFEYVIGGETITGTDLMRIVEHPGTLEMYLGDDVASQFLKNPINTFVKAGPELKRIIANMAKQARLERR